MKNKIATTLIVGLGSLLLVAGASLIALHCTLVGGGLCSPLESFFGSDFIIGAIRTAMYVVPIFALIAGPILIFNRRKKREIN